jgi:hypothetical protein
MNHSDGRHGSLGSCFKRFKPIDFSKRSVDKTTYGVRVTKASAGIDWGPSGHPPEWRGKKASGGPSALNMADGV